MKRAVYDKQFKMAAVKHAQSVDQSVIEVAKTLGISGSTLRRWINEYDQYGESAFPGYTLPRIVRTAQKTPPCRGILSFKRSGAA